VVLLRDEQNVFCQRIVQCIKREKIEYVFCVHEENEKGKKPQKIFQSLRGDKVSFT